MSTEASRSGRRISPQVLRHVLAARPAILAFLVSLLRDLHVAEEVFKDLCVAASQGKLEGVTDEKLSPILKAARIRAMARLHARATHGSHLPPDELVDRIEQAVIEMTEPQPPWDQRREALQRALRALPSALRQIFDLRYGRRVAISEMASRLGLDSDVIRQQLHQARITLQAELKPSQAEGQTP
jgi:RNA polymerase sigma factor (sigma-70 family)